MFSTPEGLNYGRRSMSTFTQILYHIIFATKDRQRVLRADGRQDLYKYIWGVVRNNNCHLYRIGGVEDHVHILTHVHPTVAIAELVKSIKVSTSVCIKEQRVFPEFDVWQEEYGAFTHSIHEKEALIKYIKSQEEHHRVQTFREELAELLKQADVPYDERYLE